MVGWVLVVKTKPLLVKKSVFCIFWGLGLFVQMSAFIHYFPVLF
jgi:hypothetical protein